MVSTYPAGPVSIAGAPQNARLWLVLGQNCAEAPVMQSVINTLTDEHRLAPLTAGQGTGMSAASRTIDAKRLTTFDKTHLGPQLRSGAG